MMETLDTSGTSEVNETRTSHGKPEGGMPLPTMADEEFLDLIEANRCAFFRFLHHRVWNKDDVEDVFSEAVMVAWEKRASFHMGTNFRAWLYRILLNKSFVANRHTACNSIDYDSLPEMNSAKKKEEPKAFADSDSFLEQIDDELLLALSRLRSPERRCLLLRARDDYSYREIAETMGIPAGTVMTHLARGRNRIRRVLREQRMEGEGTSVRQDGQRFRRSLCAGLV